MKKILSILLLSTAAFILWTGCQNYSGDQNAMAHPVTPTPSLLPASMMTADAARLSVDLTKQAGEGELAGLAIRQTQVVLEVTQAVATEQYFVRMTEISAQSTATQEARETSVAQANATGTAAAIQANATGTAMQYAFESAVRGTTTAEYQQSIALAATSSAIDRDVRSEENTLWFSTWAPRVFLSILFVMGLVGAGVGGKALWDARWIIAAHLGVVRWGPDGKPYLIAPAFDKDGVVDGITFVDPDRMLSSGVTVLPGKTEELDQKITETTRLLNASGAQQVSYKLASNTGTIDGSQRSTNGTDRSFVSPAPALQDSQQSQLPAEIKIVVMPANDKRIADWIEDATSQIIDGEASDA